MLRKNLNKICVFIIIIFSLNLLIPFNDLQAENGTSLYLAPARGTYFVDSTFDVSIFVNTGGKQINAVQVELKFPPDKLQVVNPSAGNSFISVWVAQPTYSNSKGTISFQGGIPNPGINTSSGLISTITFRGRASGTAEISFSDSCKVLLNDANGTNVLTSVNKGIYTIVIPPPEGPVVYSSTHSDQNKWYKNNSPAFNWEKDQGVSDFSYSIDNDPQGVPDNTSEGSDTSFAFNNLEDGIWYFHIKAMRGGSWGGISHFPVKIDATPPAEFSIKLETSGSAQPIVSFLTTDAFSGINHYEFKLIFISNEQESQTVSFFTEVVSPFKIPEQKSGTYGVVIRAYDPAGNWRDAIKTVEITASSEKSGWLQSIIKIGIDTGKIIYFYVIIFIILLGFGFFFHAKKKRKRLKKEFAKVKKSVGASFQALKDETKEKELLANLGTAEDYIDKEIRDVEKELK